MPNGKPTATTWSPGARSAVERMVAAIRSSGILLACSTARSFSACTPVMRASASSPSENVTLMRSAPCTTCRLVRMMPLSTITTPEPMPRSTSSSSALASPASDLPGAGFTSFRRLFLTKLTTRTTDGRMFS
jgi:hypothetical protein